MSPPSIISFEGKTPVIHPTAFIAPGCRIIGDVEIGANVSIWYNCVLRGDVNSIRVGTGTNIEDGTVIHCDGPKPRRPGFATLIGCEVLVGHMALIHGATLHDRCFVGLGSVAMDGCEIQSGAMLAAGALLTPGKIIHSGQLWAGRPAKFMRDLTSAEQIGNGLAVAHYQALGSRHRLALRA